MKRIFLSIIWLINFFQTGMSQNDYTLRGVVISQISQLPVLDAPYFRIRIKGDSVRYVSLDKNAEFRIKGLKKGRYEITLEMSNEIGDFYFREGIDTVLIIDKNNKTEIKLFRKDKDWCEGGLIDKQRALNDIEKGKISLFLPPTGISGDMNLTPHDFEFEKKYNVRYQAFGCTFPDFECFRIYNLTIFGYLDKKFNKTWRKEARTNVLFLK